MRPSLGQSGLTSWHPAIAWRVTPALRWRRPRLTGGRHDQHGVPVGKLRRPGRAGCPMSRAGTITIYRCENAGCGKEVDLSAETYSLAGPCEGTHPELGKVGMHIYQPVKIDRIPDQVPAAW